MSGNFIIRAALLGAVLSLLSAGAMAGGREGHHTPPWQHPHDGKANHWSHCKGSEHSACRLPPWCKTVSRHHGKHGRFLRGPGHGRHPHWWLRQCSDVPPDGDRDGIADGDDACPSTPRRARALDAGCAAHEVVADPERIARPMRRAYTRALGYLRHSTRRTVPLFEMHREELDKRLGLALERIDSGLRRVANGDVCTGAEDVSAGSDVAEDTRLLIADALREQWALLVEQVSPDDVDADAAEVAFHEAAYQASVISRAVSEMTALSEAVGNVCGQVTRRVEFRAVVASTDDGAGIIRLTNGRYVAVGDDLDSNPIFEGSTVSIRSNQFADGQHGALQVSQLDSGVTDLANQPDFPCSFLRIAPFQEFAPEAPPVGDYVLHDPAGYRADDGSYVVESVTRFAARRFSACPTRSPSGSGRGLGFRYSLELQFRGFNETSFKTFASDLRHGETPVALPEQYLPITPGTTSEGVLRVVDKIATCRGRRCGTPKVHTTRDYPLQIFARGDLVLAVDTNTRFDLEDWDTTSFEAGIVFGITPAPELDGLPVAFSAQGWSTDGSRTLVNINDTTSRFYAIYQDDFVGFNDPGALAQHGTLMRSGLRWPRIVGTRGGWPFWYSARPPAIIRDRVGDCVPGPDAFYRYPWDFNTTYRVGQGNQSPPAGDPDDNPSHVLGGSQQFAFDFSLPSSTVVRAARGGFVDWFRTGQTANFDSSRDVSPDNIPFPNGSQSNWGNAVRIAHQDGTFAWYFHLENGSIQLGLNQRIERGQPIALSDNTGRSSGPHLHFQVQGDDIDWGPSIQIRFDADCRIPVSGDNAFSFNENPNFP